MRELPRPGSGGTAMGRYRTCLSYLQALYGKLDDGWISLWRKRDKRSGWVHVQDLRKAVRSLLREAPQGCVYHAWGIQSERQGEGRGGDATVCAIPGLWADVDVANGAAHARSDLPPSLTAALGALREFPPPPTLIIGSGHGLYLLWLFHEPMLLASDQDRAMAHNLLAGIQDSLRTDCMAPRGWHLDSTSALSHLVRPPGTINHKTRPVSVSVLRSQDVYYNPSDFACYRPSQPLQAVTTAVRVGEGGPRTHRLADELLLGAPCPGDRHRLLTSGGLLIFAWSWFGPTEGLEVLRRWSERGCDAKKARERLSELDSAWRLLERKMATGDLAPMTFHHGP